MSRLRWDHFQARRSAPAVIVAGVVLAVITVGSLVGDPAVTRHDALTIDAPVYAVEAPVPVGEPVVTTSPSSSSVAVPGGTAHVPGSPTAPTQYAELTSDPAIERLPATAATPLPIWEPAPGDCSAWATVFASYGATDDEVAFFVPRILDRESGCGRDTLNDSTGDTGVCQISPVHNRAGYFGRVQYGPGGWLLELHGLTTRVDTDSPAWAAACLTLYRVCGAGPWQPPYSCANRRLPS